MSSTKFQFRSVIALVCLYSPVVSREMRAQDKPQPTIACTVQGRPITLSQLERDLSLVVKDRKLPPEQVETLKRQVLQHAIDRRLVLHYLLTTRQGASPEDVELMMARLQKKLDNEGMMLPDFLQQRGQTEAEFRDEQLWELSWERYLERKLTEATLQKYFDKNRREFDGTELRIAHILFAPPKKAGPAEWNQLHKQAAAIRQDIADKKLSFADAAKLHSSSPTGAAGGDIGWIKRREPMPEAFSSAAFRLQPGEVSPPVASTFGVHLISCLEVKAGTRTWQQVADELRPAIIRYLFRWIADKERPAAKIEYTDHWPH